MGKATGVDYRLGHRSDRCRITIIDLPAPDTYALLILAPAAPLGSGWLGEDRVVGRAAIRDLLIKAARFTPEERKRLSVHMPGRAITLRLDEVERLLATGRSGPG